MNPRILGCENPSRCNNIELKSSLHAEGFSPHSQENPSRVFIPGHKKFYPYGSDCSVGKEIQVPDLKEKEPQNLKRELASNEKNYKTYLEKAEEARISDDLNRQKMANISVIQAASVPAKPIKPKKALNIALGIILGAVSGLGLAFFSEYTNQGLSTPEGAERHLGLPVLGTVPFKEEE